MNMLSYTPESIQKARKLISFAWKSLPTEVCNLVNRGPISCRVNDEYMVIAASETNSTELAFEDMVPVKINDLPSQEGPLAAESLLHAKIYQHRKEIHAIIQTKSNNSEAITASGSEIPPLLDDMAQIIGPTIRVTAFATFGPPVKPVIQALAGRNAVLLRRQGGICLGRDMEEALVSCRILEKSCQTFIESKLMGGGIPVSAMAAWIMHQYFLRKYSKQKKLSTE
jgi:L-fuculose-phosphate aldolase